MNEQQSGLFKEIDRELKHRPLWIGRLDIYARRAYLDKS